MSLAGTLARSQREMLYRALYDFKGQNKGDLTLRRGDIVVVTDRESDHDWWAGEAKRGARMGRLATASLP
jgi:hypothetical protein